MNIKHWVAAIVLTTPTLSAWALPTVDTVQAEVQRGNYAQAEVMMQDVVAAKPGSARAHYLYAEILAHNKRFGEAAKESARARQIDPALSFTDPTKFKALESLLAREQLAARPRAATSTTLPTPTTAIANARPAAAPETERGMPSWVWALGLGGIAALVWALVSRRQQAASAGMGLSDRPAVQPQTTAYGPVTAPGYGAAAAPGYGAAATPGYPPGYGQTAARGTGLMGVGLAAAGGVAAGMLAEKLLHGGTNLASNTGLTQGSGPSSPGLFDDAQVNNPAVRELEQRPVDFGNGDGWGGDNADTADGGSDQDADGW